MHQCPMPMEQYSMYMYQYPQQMMPYPMTYHMPQHMPHHYMMQVRPLVQYGLAEAQITGVPHAMTEVALIAYLMGMGYPFPRARAIVEAWEAAGIFPGNGMI